MTITDLKQGHIYRLTEPLALSGAPDKKQTPCEYVQIQSIKPGEIVALLGVMSHGDFFRRTFFRGKEPVRIVTIIASQIAQFIKTGELEMSNKKTDAGNETVNETTYEMDEDQAVEATDNEGNTGKAKAPMTAAEKIAEIKRQEQEKIDAVKKKEDARQKAATDKRVEKLKTAADKAGMKEADVVAEFGGEAKSFKGMDDDQTKAALEGLKTRASEKAKADKAIEKNATKLAELAEKAGVKEAEVAAEHSAARTKKFADLTSEEGEKAIAALKEKANDKKKADALALKTTLTAEEEVELKGFEKIVEKNLQNFQTAAFQIGAALTGINQKKLYRSTKGADGEPVKTFEQYVSERFGLSRPHAYSVMTAAVTFQALTEGQAVDVKQLPSITAAEAISRGVKGLIKEAGIAEDNPELDAVTRQVARNVYQIAVQNAPVDKDGKPILSPGHLQSTFEVLGEVARTGLVEIDGQQVPINLAAATIDEMITEQTVERTGRMRASLQERIQQAEAAAKEAKPSKLDAALNSATGNGNAIPQGVTPKLTVICSVHGRNTVDVTSDNDIKLGCGCVFVSTPEGYLFDEKQGK